jgi:hypothetical protein
MRGQADNEKALRSDVQLRFNELELQLLNLQKLNRELKNENRHLQQNKISGIEKERSEKQMLSLKATQERGELRDQVNVLRQQLHDERTAWGLEKRDLQSQIDQSSTEVSTMQLKLNSLSAEVFALELPFLPIPLTPPPSRRSNDSCS